MCVNIRKITNKYTGLSVYVPCGKCAACQQEKAAKRATRIRNNNKLGYIALFITLTYDRLSCPVVFREDLHSRCSDLNVYRLNTLRRVRTGSKYKIVLKRQYKLTKIGTLSDCVYPDTLQDSTIPKLVHLNDKYVGICYYKDVQDFFKRLKYYITYNYGDKQDFKYSYFVTSEYGETTFRPHHHALLFVPSKYEKQAKEAVLESWPFGDRRRTGQYVQVAKDAASYVASYVNCDSDFPELFKTSTFRPKHSMSKGFGVGLECFTLSQILEKTNRRDLSYNSVTTKDGVANVVACTIPKYVINRYFPKYKGYSARSDGENRLFICEPARYSRIPSKELYDKLTASVDLKESLRYGGTRLSKFVDKYNFRNSLSPDELREIDISLRHAYELYHRETGRSRHDYAIDFVRVWNCYHSTSMRHFYESAAEHNYIDAYDNIADYAFKRVRSLNLDEFGLEITSLDPNEMQLNKQKHLRLLQTYELKKKTRKVSNIIMSRNGHFV